MHNGNTTVIPVNGQLRKVVIDLDDFYLGPHFFDFLNLLAILKIETVKDIKYHDVYVAYLAGLAGEKASMPEALETALATSHDEYHALAAEVVQKYLNKAGDGFQFVNNKLENISQKNKERIKAQLTPSFQDAEIIDVGIRPIAEGGSKGKLRYWVLVRWSHPSGRHNPQIYEVSQFQSTGVSEFTVQQFEPRQLFNKFLELNYGEHPPKDLQLLIIDGEYFVLRPKKIELFEIPKYSEEPDAYIKLSLYNVQEQGLRHRQTMSPGYLKTFKDQSDLIQRLMKRFAKAYIHEIELRQGETLEGDEVEILSNVFNPLSSRATLK